MSVATPATPPVSQETTEEWLQEFLTSPTYQRPGQNGRGGRSPKALDRSVKDRRTASKGARGYYNALLSAPGSEGLNMPREFPVFVSVWGNGLGYVSGFEDARVRIHVSREDSQGEWVPRSWVKQLPTK